MAAAASGAAAAAIGSPAGGSLRLLKVPRWLSEAWLKAGPEAMVADIDLESGKLHLLPGSGCGDDRPQTLTIECRASPELFAFAETPGGDGKGLEIVGDISHAMHARADLQDQAYRKMLQQRAVAAQISSGARTAHEERLPTSYQNEHTSSGAAAGAEVFAKERLQFLSVALAVKKCLLAEPKGVTFDGVMDSLPQGSLLTEVRDALVAMAELREVDGRRLFCASDALLRASGARTGATAAAAQAPAAMKRQAAEAPGLAADVTCPPMSTLQPAMKTA
eukprot:TRINITY_DN31411_c0_g1_i3.p1 TRINITY_DN31411_c0_g1~~TRINITY_DN31411_c0_g1_i3.p1  ORF type:complete len:278 (-),score=84.43 TRINITY_DN31411_c0_g1_i3:58-891(-)